MRGQWLVLLSQETCSTTLIEVVVVHGSGLLTFRTVSGLDISSGGIRPFEGST